jgi:hypothetical protein
MCLWVCLFFISRALFPPVIDVDVEVVECELEIRDVGLDLGVVD